MLTDGQVDPQKVVVYPGSEMLCRFNKDRSTDTGYSKNGLENILVEERGQTQKKIRHMLLCR